MDTVHIFDTTLRDGEQSPGFSMNTNEKLRMARQLAALNVDVIEAGFPIALRGDLEAVQHDARIPGQDKGAVQRIGGGQDGCVLARAEHHDIALALQHEIA